MNDDKIYIKKLSKQIKYMIKSEGNKNWFNIYIR